MAPKAMADKGKAACKEDNSSPKKRTIRDLNLLPEEIFGTEEVPEHILSDSSSEEENATAEQKTIHQLRRRVRHLEHNLRNITALCHAERDRRMSLEVVIGDMSDRHNNLKAAWDRLMEAAEHSSLQGFRVAVTVILEQLKRDELKRKTAGPKK